MRLYSDFATRRTFEIIGDLVALAIIVIGIASALALHATIAAVGEVGRQLESAGTSITTPMSGIADGLTDNSIPFDDFLAPPFEGIRDGGQTLVDAGASFQNSVELVATIVGWTVAVLVVLIVILGWIAPRVLATVRRTRLARLAESAPSRDLLAFRALANRPAAALARIDDAVGGWRRGHAPTVDALATLELRAGGVRVRARRS